MAKDFEEYMFEDECCLNCGELNFEPSKIPGVCRDCMVENAGAARSPASISQTKILN